MNLLTSKFCFYLLDSGIAKHVCSVLCKVVCIAPIIQM